MSHPAPKDLAGLSADARRTLLAELLRRRAGADAPEHSVSYGQQALWYLHQLVPGSAAHHVVLSLRVRSALDLGALRRALRDLRERHASLRTTFPGEGGAPRQRIGHASDVTIEEIDAATWSEAELRGRVVEASRQPFDLEEGPLFRVQLFRRMAHDQVLLVTIQHIVVDGWSMALLLRELASLYLAEATGAPAGLPRVAAEYVDYVRWQAEMLKSPEGERLAAYWQGALARERPPLALPTDRPRPAARAYCGTSHAFVLDRELTGRLRALATAEEASIYAVLLAGFQALLHRYTGQEDILVGSPVAGRSHPGFSDVVGYFVNMVTLRGDASGNPPFRHFLAALRARVLGALEHEQYPFPLVVKTLGIDRDLSRTPVFQAAFNYMKVREDDQLGALAFTPGFAGRVEVAGLTLEPFPVPQQEGQFDLTLEMFEVGGLLHGRLKYDTALWERSTIARMVGHLETLLYGVTREPDARLGDLPLLTAAERRQLLVDWNATAEDYRRDACLHDLIAAQAARTPDARAVSCGGAALTYGELDRRGNQLARHLRGLGVGPGVLVAVCLERSVDMLVGLLGILKAGAAYVPLDAAHPRERLAFILSDAGAPVLLTHRGLEPALAAPTGHVVRVDADWPAIARESPAAVSSGVGPRDLMYVLYTSGSTGQPKGAGIEHRSVVSYLSGLNRLLVLDGIRTIAAITSLTFDASVKQLFGPLLRGDEVWLLPDATASDPAALVEALGRRRGVALNCVPSLWMAVLDLVEADEARFPPGSLTALLLGGERWGGELLRRSFAAVPDLEIVWNCYGPTETTANATIARIRPGETVTIGRPLPNTQAYVLDLHGQPVPVGVSGELYIGGDGVARGYLDRPELTAERFVPDPFDPTPGARLYRTGDLVRFLADGRIEYQGRTDHQVKIRGQRVELGEIEEALRRAPGVRDAVVSVREEVVGNGQLVAHVAVPEGAARSATLLRSHLRATLPEHMVPTTVVFLDALPLTPTGKIDRLALSSVDVVAAADGAVTQPRAPVEELLAGIWAEVLGREEVGSGASFFDLGGHSLLATQVMSRVRRSFGVELPVRSLFERPTVAELAEAIEAARRGDAPGLPATVPLRRVARQGPCVTSFAQQRLWLLDQVESGSPVYNVPAVLRLTGRLDVAALQASLEAVVQRHETLRTTFEACDGEPTQVVAPVARCPLPVIDLRHLPEPERDHEALRLAAEEARRPFDLRRGPPIRGTVLRLGDEVHWLLVTKHHIASDGWSMGVLGREVAALYRAAATGQPADLPALPIQYADFAAWQREWLQGPVLERQITYWRRQLGDPPPLLELPTDRRRPAQQTYRGGGVVGELGPTLVRGLKTVARREGVTLFMVLLAGFKALLARYSGQDDIVVGTPVAGRNRLEVEGLIGFFVNTLVLRTDLSGEPSFRGLLRRVREVTLGAYSHQDLPFEKLVEVLQPVRDLSRSPLFQVMFVLQNAPMPVMDLPGLSVDAVPVDTKTAKFDLTLFAREAGDHIHLWWEYGRDLFEAETVRRMSRHFETLLARAVADADRSIWELPLLDEAERRQVVVEWNRTEAEYPRGARLHTLFATQAGRTPMAPALVTDEGSLTYAEVERRANQLARHLRGLGVGPEVPVGVCLPRSAEMVITLLGILKAGGAYVPLDPAYPTERLAFMLADAGAPVVVTTTGLETRLAAPEGKRIVRLDQDRAAIAQEPVDGVMDGTTPDSLAYVIYTSGSTGVPKGVAGLHRGAVNRLAWMWKTNPYRPGEVCVQKTALSFVDSVAEIFGALLAGVPLVLVSEEAVKDLGWLVATLAAHRVTRIVVVPSLLVALLDTFPDLGARLPGLDFWVTSGEALSGALARRFHERLPGRRLLNLYGSSEASADSTWYETRDDEGERAPIGRPIANTRAYVLDGRGQPVPVGVPGELYIGGDGLARGYSGRPELTAARFVPDPFDPTPGGRLYRTGDVARYRADGLLEYLGRGDHQVKIRGQRVELGEVETALRGHPAIRDVAVVAREDGSGDRRLVAYVVGAGDGKGPETAEIRIHLRRTLPEHMVPSSFVRLEALPLTPSGKLARQALPPPGQDGDGAEPAFIAPRTPIEATLARIWTEVLGRSCVGVHENFFDLGGHSLLAARVMARLPGALGVELPLRRLFETPTIAALAEAIDEGAGREAVGGAPGIPLRPIPRDDPLPLSFAQERLWFLDQFEPGTATYNIPGAIRLRGTLDVAALEGAFGEIARRHEALRTTFQTVDGQPFQVIAPDGSWPLHHVDLTGLPEAARQAEAVRLAREEAGRPFDLAVGPLYRAALLRLAATEHILLVTLHHVVADGWSLVQLVLELWHFYDGFVTGRAIPLPELPVQYADYAAWQRRWLAGAELERQVAYWKEALAGMPAALDLPTDRVHPLAQTFRGRRARRELPAELRDALHALGRREGVTLFMTLLAAFQLQLARYAGQDDVAVGTPIANRARPELEGLIGFFVNTLVLRTSLAGDPTVRELLGRVREVTLGAYAHQDVPFEKLVEVLQPVRDLSRSPLFQVMLALQNVPMAGVTYPALALEAVEVDGGTAKFDLTVTCHESGRGLALSWEYNADLFEPETIERMMAHYRRLLEAMVAEPDERVSTLPLLTEAERATLLVQWNATDAEFPRSCCVHELVSAQAARTPNAVAVTGEEAVLTYGELDRRANRLAHHLRALGVAPGALVGVALERSAEMVVALLAVLKAGGGYVPLDPTFPAERLAFMVEDARVAALVTEERWRGRFVTDARPLVSLDRSAGQFAAWPDTPPAGSATPEDLAYVIYTSGSTGRPKGVAVPHRAVVNFLCAMRATLGVGARDVLLAVTTIAFDIAALELYLPLAAGGRTVIASREVAVDGRQLATRLVAGDITVMQATPATWRMLVEAGWSGTPGLRIFCGGEALPRALAAELGRRGAEVWNLYGPTETTIWSTAERIEATEGPVSIGRPIANTRVYVLDPQGQPVPVGVPGELYIGGAGVAHGYHDRPELTAERFVPDPFGPIPGARLYRTGDRVRYGGDGRLTYLGRLDHQVKVRGFRVEPGEVEAVLRQHPGVRDVVVVAREVEPGDARLLGYVVPAGEEPPSVGQLRVFVQGKLPDPMVPSGFVFLPVLPLTPNGKVDRRALPPPESARPGLDSAFAPPRTDTETALAEIWRDVLGLDRVGIHDNFFELGGHSLLAIRVMARVRHAFGVDVPVRALFEAPTVAVLAERLTLTLLAARARAPALEGREEMTI